MWQRKAAKPLQRYVQPILILKTSARRVDVNMLARHPDPVIEATPDIKQIITRVIKDEKQVKQLLEYIEDEIKGFEG